MVTVCVGLTHSRWLICSSVAGLGCDTTLPQPPGGAAARLGGAFDAARPPAAKAAALVRAFEGTGPLVAFRAAGEAAATPPTDSTPRAPRESPRHRKRPRSKSAVWVSRSCRDSARHDPRPRGVVSSKTCGEIP